MLVIDASITLAWVLPDEQDAFASEALELVGDEGGLVPALWALEVGNALLVAQRRKRISPSQFEKSLVKLRELPIRVSQSAPEGDFGQVLDLANRHRLTSYDAAYLELAIRAASPLATLDTALGKAAHEHQLAFNARRE